MHNSDLKNFFESDTGCISSCDVLSLVRFFMLEIVSARIQEELMEGRDEGQLTPH